MGRKKTISDAELLAVARRAFISGGFGVSTKKIARASGLSEGVLFQRFHTKAELFFAAMVPPSADKKRFFAGVRAGKHALQRIEQIAFELLKYWRSVVPVLLPLMTHPGFRFEEFAQRHPDSPIPGLRREIVEFLTSEREAGRIGKIDPRAAALVLVSSTLGMALFEKLGAHGGRFERAMVRGSVHAFWEGLAPVRRG